MPSMASTELHSKSVQLLDKLLCDERLPHLPRDVTVYRGISKSKESFDDILTDKAQKSTSFKPFVALRFCKNEYTCVILQIEIAAGTPFLMPQPQSDFLNEQEILLPRNTRFIQTGDFLHTTMYDKKVIVVPVRAVFHCEVKPAKKR